MQRHTRCVLAKRQACRRTHAVGDHNVGKTESGAGEIRESLRHAIRVVRVLHLVQIDETRMPLAQF